MRTKQVLIRFTRDFENSKLEVKEDGWYLFKKWRLLGEPKSDQEYYDMILEFAETLEGDRNIHLRLYVVDLENF